MPKQKKRWPSTSPQPRRGETEKVQIAANSYCLSHYGVRCSGGIPRRLQIRGADIWIVPVVFTSPGYGAVGDVGMVAIDAATHEVVGAMPQKEVRAALARLAQEKGDELEAAFHQASKV